MSRWPAPVLACLLAGCAGKPEGFTPVAEIDSVTLASAGSVAVFDANGDGRPDILAGRLFFNDGDGTLREAAFRLPGPALAIAAADYDNAGRVDFYATEPEGGRLFHNEGAGTFKDVTAAAGLGGRRRSAGAFFADFDNSGAPDLFIPPLSGRALLFKNLGNGRFQERGSRLGISKSGSHLLGFASDLDHDYDVDALVAGGDAPIEVWRNDRLQGFHEDAAACGLDKVKGASALLVDDFNNDRIRDVFVVSTGCAPNRLFIRRGYGPFQEARRGRADLGFGGKAAAAFDFDNDGNQDILVSGACRPESGGFLLLRNRGDGTFEDATARLGIKAEGRDTGGAFAMGDLDGDSSLDVVLLRRSGLTVLRNQAGRKNHWLDVALTGAQGSSKDGLGAKVEVKAGDLWVQRELASPGPLHFGLGRHAKADLVRVTWPTGIRQNLTDVKADQVVRIQEKGQKSSCPFLFAWTGAKYRFVTDFLGAGFIGILTGPDTYYKPRSDEFLRLENGLLEPKDGKYLLSISERLEEVDYLDQVKLLAVDHPRDAEVHPNERLLMNPPWPEAKVIAVRGARPPKSAVDDRGQDILPRLLAKDRQFADSFDLLPFEGYTQRHSITLDLGDAGRHGEPAILLLDGYVRYWTSNSAYLASQNGLRLEPPGVEVKDRRGRWVQVVADMGFPAGLPKTIVADLTGKFLSADRHIRITTNMEIYWDRIRVATRQVSPSELRVSELIPEHADLAWLGYPKMTTPDGRPPFEYDYDDRESSTPWRRQEGFYTDYGDVTPLIGKKDDEFVIMGHGERLALSFDAARLPALPSGWQRDFFVYVDGFVKEMNPHTAYLHTVEPLPFHAMSNYPYRPAEHYPDDPEHAAYRRKFNSRRVSAADALGAVVRR